MKNINKYKYQLARELRKGKCSFTDIQAFTNGYLAALYNNNLINHHEYKELIKEENE